MEKEMIDILKTEPAYFGRQGENIAREVIFDITSLKKEFPDAVYALILQRHDEMESYTAVTTTVVGNEFRYRPTFWATEIPGEGKWEIHALDAETGLVAKSIQGTFNVDDALDQPVDAAPEVARNWLQEVQTARDEAVAAAQQAMDVVSIDVEDIQQRLSGKLDAPEEAGENGQLLMSDGAGGQTWSDPPETYVLPRATTRVLGGVIVGDGLMVDGDGKLSAPASQPATESRDGLLRAIDQRKLNTVEEGANHYILPKAALETLGGIIVGDNLSVDGDGRLSADAERLRPATPSRLGGIKVGQHLVASADGTLNVDLARATAETLGGIKVGRNLTVESDGTLNAVDSYELPSATPVRLGGVRVGNNLSIDNNGVLSADAQPIQPATANELGGIKIGDGLSIDETGIASAFTYDINKTLKEDGKTYQLNLIRSTGNDETVVNSVDLPAGGGGGGGSSVEGFYLNIERVTSSPIIATPNDTVTVVVDIQSREGSDPNAPFIDGTYTWKIGTNTLMAGPFSRVRNSFDLTPYLSTGTQRVSLTVTQSDSGLSQTKTWNIQLTDVRMASDFQDEYTNPAGELVGFTYIPYGAGVQKIAHFKLDGTELDPVTLSANVSGTTQTYLIPASTHGTHTLEAWLVATVGANIVESNHIYKDIIWYDEDATTPILSSSQKILPVPVTAPFDENLTYYEKVNGLYQISGITEDSWASHGELYYTDISMVQYSSVPIRFNVYDPTTENPVVELYEDGTLVATRTLTSSMNNYWNYNPEQGGVHTLTIRCGSVSIDVVANVEALAVDIHPVTANLMLDFNPAGRNNNDANRLWSYTNASNDSYHMRVSSGFDWANGGYQQDENGDTAFVIKAGDRATIDCKMFLRDQMLTKRNGQHFKVIFKTTNVRDASATWLECMGSTGEIGVRLNTHEGYLFSGNASSNLYSPYSEGDRIEYEYDIQPLDMTSSTTTSYMMSYEDGTMFRPIVYDSSNTLQQIPASEITIGSDDCDVWIYRMKIYSASLTPAEVMANFIADAPNGEEMYARYIRNQIYDQDNLLTPEHLAEVCPDLRIIKISAPHFTNKKSNTVGDTTVQCIYRGGDPVLDNWTVTNAAHSGQGTTSDNYGVSGRNIDLKLKKDDKVGANPVCTFGDGSQSAPGKVSISLSRNSIPTNYFNIKVNIASSENANNALLAKRYDRYLPYETPAHKRDPRIKTTMEFFNCAIFIQETGDLSIHEEFADNNWHFYGIGNIGDSKKTDSTRVYTPNDPKEFVNEILDNTKPNSQFDTGVYNLIVESIPATGDRFTDYYTMNNDSTFMLRRYLNGSWQTVKSSVKEITNGAVAVLSARPTTGIFGIEYYIPSGSTYNMYTWNGERWSVASVQTSADLANARKNHMAVSIDPAQWMAGNEKYDAMMADDFGGDLTWEMRYEAAEKIFEDDDAAYSAQHAENITLWRQMYAWMVTSTDEQFVAEIGNWFYKDAALYAYLFTEQYTMMDNRAKNTFWHWAKFYVSQAEHEASDICYTKVADNASFDQEATYYTKDGADYDRWTGEWNSRPTLYVHNNCYIVNDAAAAIHDGYRFDFWDYDNDSSIGINNTGSLNLSYGREDIDYTVANDMTSQKVYNASDSIFWRRIRLLMHNDLVAMYQQLENTGCWTASGFISEFDAWQNQWPEELWRKDAERKYLRPYYGTSVDNSTLRSADGQTVKNSAVYLTEMLNGRKKYQRRQWIRDQVVYMGTKYLASSITNNNIMIRCYQPIGPVVPADYTLHIVPFNDMYLSVLFGSGNASQIVRVRAKAGERYSLACPIDMNNATDQPFYIYAASYIQELSDLSACYFAFNDFSNATRLKRLKVGNSTPGYTNRIPYLSLGEGRHDLLESLDVTNCTNLVGTANSGTMNLAGCGRLKEFLAAGTAISSVIFATNGQLETAVLPESLTGLTMIGLDHLTDFTATYDHLLSLSIEGGAIDSRAIIGDAYDTIRSLRAVDVDWTGDNAFADATILNALSDMNNMYDSYVSGRAHIAGAVTQRELDHYADIWPYLIVTYESTTPEHLVQYVNADANHTLLGYEYVVAGSTLTNPIGRVIFGPEGDNITLGTPTMEQSEQYTFEFSHWDGLDGYVTRPRTVTAAYTNVTRKYTVNWYGKINGLKLASGEYEYGSEAVYDYTPTRDTTINANKTYYYKPAESFIEYHENWEYPPQLYEKNEIPTDISGESREAYRLFAGWDKSTGYVMPDSNNADGHIDVYAVWSECNGLPELDTATETLSAVQVYAISRQTNAVVQQYFSMDRPDYVLAELGFSPEFSNVRSETLISEKRWFDGTAGEILLDGNGQPLRLFAADAPSFTLAIDFEMRDGGSAGNEKTLIGCYTSEGAMGFRLKCGLRTSDGGYRPIIEWGNQSFDVGYSYPYGANDSYSDTRYRDMVVIRHRAGDQTLHVYTSNAGQYFTISGVTRYSKTRSNYMPTNTPLVVGGEYIEREETFNNNRFGTGYIYGCKIWYDDLGETVCQRIASWPRETIALEYYGTQRYYLPEGDGRYKTTASFISKQPLYGRSVFAESNYSVDAHWSNSPVRSFMINRVLPAMSNEWQSMLRPATVNTVLGSAPFSGVEVTNDKMFAPAYAEVDAITSNPFIQEQFSNSSNEGTMITWFSNHASRIKSKVLYIRPNPNIWTGVTDPTTQVGRNVRVGDLWIQALNGGYPGFVFMDRDTIARDHLTVKAGTTPTSAGGWVQSATAWGLRTPSSAVLNNGHQYQYYGVSALGVVQQNYAYTTSNDYGDGVGIVVCVSI